MSAFRRYDLKKETNKRLQSANIGPDVESVKKSKIISTSSSSSSSSSSEKNLSSLSGSRSSDGSDLTTRFIEFSGLASSASYHSSTSPSQQMMLSSISEDYKNSPPKFINDDQSIQQYLQPYLPHHEIDEKLSSSILQAPPFSDFFCKAPQDDTLRSLPACSRYNRCHFIHSQIAHLLIQNETLAYLWGAPTYFMHHLTGLSCSGDTSGTTTSQVKMWVNI